MMTLEGVNPQMIANNLKPFQPTHPGEVLKDELEYRGISQRGLAKEIHFLLRLQRNAERQAFAQS